MIISHQNVHSTACKFYFFVIDATRYGSNRTLWKERKEVADEYLNVTEKKKTRRDVKMMQKILHLVYFFLEAFSADFVTAARI